MKSGVPHWARSATNLPRMKTTAVMHESDKLDLGFRRLKNRCFISSKFHQLRQTRWPILNFVRVKFYHNFIGGDKKYVQLTTEGPSVPFCIPRILHIRYDVPFRFYQLALLKHQICTYKRSLGSTATLRALLVQSFFQHSTGPTHSTTVGHNRGRNPASAINWSCTNKWISREKVVFLFARFCIY